MKRLLVCLLLVGVVGCGSDAQEEKAKAEAEFNKGVGFADREDEVSAIACFTEAIRIDPDYAAAYYNRGIVYDQLGINVRAKADFAKAAELSWGAALVKIQLDLVSQQLELYKLDMNNYPPTELGLSSLRTLPTDPVGQSRWAGPYSMKVIPSDPWGNSYQYVLETDPISGENGYKIWSTGPSGQSNGDSPDGDDVSVYSYK